MDRNILRSAQSYRRLHHLLDEWTSLKTELEQKLEIQERNTSRYHLKNKKKSFNCNFLFPFSSSPVEKMQELETSKAGLDNGY